MFYREDDDGQGNGFQSSNFPGNSIAGGLLLRQNQTGVTGLQPGMPQAWVRPASLWEGMKPRDIPFLSEDRDIPRHDRFPHHPFGPVVPDREHVDPATGRIDMDKVYSMMEDRLALADGNHDVLEKYRQQIADGERGVYATPTAQTGQGPLTTTDPRHGTGDKEEDCRRGWKRALDGKIDFYERNCRERGTCPDPRKAPDMEYENYRRKECDLK